MDPTSFDSDNLFSLLCMPMKSLKMELALKNRKLNEIEVVKMQDYNMIYASKSAFWQNSIKTTNSIKNLFRTERRERKGSNWREESLKWNLFFKLCSYRQLLSERSTNNSDGLKIASQQRSSIIFWMKLPAFAKRKSFLDMREFLHTFSHHY